MKHIPGGSDLLSTRGSVRRWFVVEEEQKDEYVLFYYKTEISKEPSGWYFLSELEEVDEDTFLQHIILRHPSRVFRLKADTIEEHRMWIHGLSLLCQPYGAKILKDGKDRYPVKVPKSAVMDPQQQMMGGRIPQAENNATTKKMELLFLQTVNNTYDCNNNEEAAVTTSLSSDLSNPREKGKLTPITTSVATSILQDKYDRYRDSEEYKNEAMCEEYDQVDSDRRTKYSHSPPSSVVTKPDYSEELEDVDDGGDGGDNRRNSNYGHSYSSSSNHQESEEILDSQGNVTKMKPTPPSHPSKVMLTKKKEAPPSGNPFPYYSLKRTTSREKIQTTITTKGTAIATTPTFPLIHKLEDTNITDKKLEQESSKCREGIQKYMPPNISEITTTLTTKTAKTSKYVGTSSNWDDWDEDLTAIIINQQHEEEQQQNKYSHGMITGRNTTTNNKRSDLSLVELCGVEPDPNFLDDDWDA